MKYFIVVPDGAADDPMKELSGKTPLEVAPMPYIDKMAASGEVGMVRTIPKGIAPGSDAANLSVMGYDPGVYLTGRSPLEAASIGIEMKDTDVAFRTNLITLYGNGAYDDLIIKDHSAGDISTEEADQLIKAVQEALGNDEVKFYTGVSYRHCMIMKGGTTGSQLTPPHDVLGKRAGDYMPKGDYSQLIGHMMRKSYEILKNHPVNLRRVEKGLNPANTLWIWGQGTKPALSSFRDKFGIGGAAISAVDLIKGIAICAGLESIDVEGATGTLHTNFEGKAQAAIDAFDQGQDFIYMHLEGPDECSHQGDLEGKIACLSDIDKRIVEPVCQALKAGSEEYSVLVVPDHRTPLSIRTHSSDPVPFVIYRSSADRAMNLENEFNEKSGAKGMYFDSGFALADYFFGVSK